MITVSMVSTSSLICMGITIFLCLVLPIFCIFIWKIKFHLPLKALFLGAGTYLIFSFFLEQFLNSCILYIPHALSDFLWEHTFAYVLYGILASALLQGLGCFLAIWLFKKDFPAREYSVFFGIGYGGIEMIFMGAISMLSALSVSISINSIGTSEYLSSLPEMETAVTSLLTSPSYLYLITGYERVLNFFLHIELSLFIYTAISKKNYVLLLIAVLSHMIFLLPTLLSQRGVFGTGQGAIFFAEGILTILFGLISFASYLVYKKYSD